MHQRMIHHVVSHTSPDPVHAKLPTCGTGVQRTLCCHRRNEAAKHAENTSNAQAAEEAATLTEQNQDTDPEL